MQSKTLTYRDYRDKVRACWLGKNIGGTLGAPFECIRGVYDLEYYTHDLSLGVLPNDDLDLQLAWLHAAETYGKNVNSEVLAEYWLSYIVPDWSEYGACKNNLRYGLQPPLSGWYHNHNKDSCGSFIRSEIWACLAPGHPEIAVKYAYEDAICDHADEGVYASLFCAALQSAAFVETDRDALIKLAKCYIPQQCAVALAVDTAIACYDEGMDWKQARKKILNVVPGSFGMYNGYKDQVPEADVPVGKLGFDAPSNIGLMMLGWLYGEGDFSKSICISAGCCEDGDCTAGTLGATLGILYGTKAIDEKWLQPIGDEIKTISLDMSNLGFKVPQTVTELTERVVNLMPTFMHGHIALNENGELVFREIQKLSAGEIKTSVLTYSTLQKQLCTSTVFVKKSCPLFDVKLIYADETLEFAAGMPKKFRLQFENKIRAQHWLEMKLYMPEGWRGNPGAEMSVFVDNRHGGNGVTAFEFEITPPMPTKSRYDLLLEIKAHGRDTAVHLPIVLLNERGVPYDALS